MSAPLFSDPRARLLSLEAPFRGATRRFEIWRRSGIFYALCLGTPRFLAVFDDDGALHAAAASGVAKEIEMQVRAWLAEERLARSVLLPDPRPNMGGAFRVVWRPERHFAFLVDGNSGEGVAFEPRIALNADEMWGERDDLWAKRWSKEWRDPRSDVRVSLAFLTSSPREREQWDIFWAKGGWDEVARIARLGAVADVDCDLGSPLVLTAPLLYLNQRAKEMTGNRPLSPRLKRLLKVLLERNRATITQTDRGRLLAPTPFRCVTHLMRASRLQLEIADPSAHEQLEARFLMREWIERNAPALLRDWQPQSPHKPNAARHQAR